MRNENEKLFFEGTSFASVNFKLMIWISISSEWMQAMSTTENTPEIVNPLKTARCGSIHFHLPGLGFLRQLQAWKLFLQVVYVCILWFCTEVSGKLSQFEGYLIHTVIFIILDLEHSETIWGWGCGGSSLHFLLKLQAMVFFIAPPIF